MTIAKVQHSNRDKNESADTLKCVFCSYDFFTHCIVVMGKTEGIPLHYFFFLSQHFGTQNSRSAV